ncbi:hypothetical protein H9Y04_35460 [Streptomyces sp. TRM66268-LWL]|uniref:Uncharacterized protein n=2 Tax=Streptomyces polyasparticus TaxID=2767826 RepID=A0ABR7SR32_9ACTN|nr:hypothetical protein [Streptomyces polyasparticus]
MCRLYELQKSGPRTAEFQDQIDTALNLALGEKRAAENPTYLCRNLLRDARRTNCRSQQRSRETAAGRPLADARHRRLVGYAPDGSVNAELITYVTPEELAVADELIQNLSSYAAALGTHGPVCLRGILQGETAAATAQRAGVSVATVERARRALRIYAETLATSES